MTIQSISPHAPRTAERVRALLAEAGLRLDDGIEQFVGLFDDDDLLIGCGGRDGNVIKCLALSAEARGQGAAAQLVGHLVNEVLNAGFTNVRVFTKPEHRDLFRSLGFTVCGEGRAALLLESDARQLQRYCDYLADHPADGVIIANADPLTRGHLHLIERAATQCRRLAVIVVAEHPKTTFPYAQRSAMLRAATAHLPNVEVLEGSDYAVSELSFPSYFLKRADDASRAQAEIDLDIFCRHLAPALGCRKRFVGTEPTDALTAQYNALMHELLPQHGIAVVEKERLTEAGDRTANNPNAPNAPNTPKNPNKPNTPNTPPAISASRVRRALAEGRLHDALPLVPPTTLPYLLARLAIIALRKELSLAPKPGLVDPYDAGAHTDMDYALMSRSIDSLQEYFTDLSLAAFRNDPLTTDALRQQGLAAERTMLRATGGVNTHRGAIFSMGLAVAATARVLSGKSAVAEDLHHIIYNKETMVMFCSAISAEIAALALPFSPATDTHGQCVRQRYRTGGALENAQSGYAQLFADWLPFYRSTARTDADALRLLLRIICQLDDSNVLYRVGPARADEARQQVARVAAMEDDSGTKNICSAENNKFSDEQERQSVAFINALHQLNADFKRDRISHGGAADMLALTFFLDAVTRC